MHVYFAIERLLACISYNFQAAIYIQLGIQALLLDVFAWYYNWSRPIYSRQSCMFCCFVDGIKKYCANFHLQPIALSSILLELYNNYYKDWGTLIKEWNALPVYTSKIASLWPGRYHEYTWLGCLNNQERIIHGRNNPNKNQKYCHWISSFH